jgi:hypothetical protein
MKRLVKRNPCQNSLIFLSLFFYQYNIIFTSCIIKNQIDPGNVGHSTQLVTRNMKGVDS